MSETFQEWQERYYAGDKLIRLRSCPCLTLSAERAFLAELDSYHATMMKSRPTPPESHI